MEASVKQSFIRIQNYVEMDGEFIVEVNCGDFDCFKKLPDAIEVHGKLLGKTGWNSDRHYACYKSNVMLGRIVDVKG